MTDRIEGVQHLRVLVSAVAGPDGGGASLGDVEKSRRGDNGGGLGDCGVLGPNGGGADVRGVDKCRRWDYGGGRGGVGGTSVDWVDGSRGGNSGGCRSRDLHVNNGVGDLSDAVFQGRRTRPLRARTCFFA
jgi:hypothetical protein